MSQQPEGQIIPCPVHGSAMVWKTGVSKTTGRDYAFWGCATKNADGSFCRAKPGMSVPTANEARFNSQLDNSRRDQAIQKMADEKRNAIELAHSENIRASALESAARIVSAKGEGDVLELAQQYLDWMKIEK